MEVADEVFEVEKILEKRIRNGVVEYKIRWKNYNESDDTWEHIDNCHCKELVKQFEEENKQMPEQNGTMNGRIERGGDQSSDDDGEFLAINTGGQSPNVEKVTYHLDDEGAQVCSVLGLTPLANGAQMALVTYTDHYSEYLPLDMVRQNETASERLLDFLLENTHFVR